MFSSAAHVEATSKIEALNKSQAVVEFDMAGDVLTANQKFLDLMGYTLDEIKGRNHRAFVAPELRESDEYKRFWADLRAGKYRAAQFKRLGKGGREVWIEASYNPIRGRDGKPFKVVKYATDITSQKTQYADLIGQINAIRKSQAVIEFDLDGTILTANETFLRAMGYTLEEIQGRHHSMFVEPAYRTSPEYKQFWEKLRRGEYQAAQFKRIGKDGREIWIEASYNPILDLNGRPFKVVKYATDVTRQVTLLTELKTLIDGNFGEIEHAIQRCSGEAGTAASAVSGAAGNVQTMAASTEELAASIREISGTMAHSKAATDTVHDQAQAADQATQRLTQAARSMGGIVEMIQSIASQINLLALNATIESARAGEAGKGFSVVAGEVKVLAKQAADATDQITREIESMQAVSAEVAGALGIIGQSIETVRQYVTATVGAVEEQTAVTQSLSSSMQSTADAVSIINGNMNEISAAVGQVAQAVLVTKNAAQVLAR